MVKCHVIGLVGTKAAVLHVSFDVDVSGPLFGLARVLKLYSDMAIAE